MNDKPLLHVAAFWVAGDHCDDLADLIAGFKITGTRGAVVTYRPDIANAWDFRRTMARLGLEEVNVHPQEAGANAGPAPEPVHRQPVDAGDNLP